MKRSIFILSAWAILLGCAVSAQAAISTTGPFTGNLTETWESFLNYTDPSFHNETDPTIIMSGGASISNPVMIVYEPSDGGATFGLAFSGSAQVSDGVKGMGLNAPSAATITFTNPVSDFGAYWGAATFQSDATVTVSFFDVFATLIGTENFTYNHENNQDGKLDWHGWSSTTLIGSLTYSGDYVVIDGLQASSDAAVPEPASLTLWGLGALGCAFAGYRRRKAA